MTINLFFLIIYGAILIGAIIFVILRQEKNKLIPKNKDDETDIEFYKIERLSRAKRLERSFRKSYPELSPLISFKRIFLFLDTLNIALLVTWLIVFVFGAPGAGTILLCLPISAPAFPSGLIAGITQSNEYSLGSMVVGWFIYFIIFLIGIIVKSRRVFVFVYLVFIMLLIINIKGCYNNAPGLDLSGLN